MLAAEKEYGAKNKWLNFREKKLVSCLCEMLATMRVDLSPRLGGHTVANQPPHYCPPLIHLHSPTAERCSLTAGVEQSHELNLNLRFKYCDLLD